MELVDHNTAILEELQKWRDYRNKSHTSNKAYQPNSYQSLNIKLESHSEPVEYPKKEKNIQMKLSFKVSDDFAELLNHLQSKISKNTQWKKIKRFTNPGEKLIQMYNR